MQKKYYIGIDLGGTYTKIGILGRHFNIIKKTSIRTQDYKQPKQLILAIKDALQEILKQAKISLTEIIGAGLGIAGLVDARTGRIYRLINIKGWNGINIKRIMEKVLRIPAFVDNDANVMTLAELHKGAGVGRRNVVCVTLGTGVGGGIVINGRLYRGSSSVAGEIGHIPINESGPRCNCGGRACVETYVGSRYFIRELRLAPSLVYEAARRGDKIAIDFWKRVGTRLGIALAGIVNMLNPDMIIIGGGVAGAGKFLFKPVEYAVRSRAMDVQGKRVKIVKAKLGEDAGLIGAAVLVEMGRDENK